MKGRLYRDGEFEREIALRYPAQEVVVPRWVQQPVSVDMLFASPPAEVLADRYNPKYAHWRPFFEARDGVRMERDYYLLRGRGEDRVLEYDFDRTEGG